MTLKEMDAKYPKIWIVSFCTILSYHDSSRLFLTETEARAFYDSLEGYHDKRIGQVHDIWGWSAKQRK